MAQNYKSLSMPLMFSPLIVPLQDASNKMVTDYEEKPRKLLPEASFNNATTDSSSLVQK